MSSLRAYFELFRLPNVFTALADIALGYGLTVSAGGGSLIVLGWLLVASAMLYTAGMVLNDVYDADVDARERPFRPIPSGRIARRFARWLGYELLAFGIAAAVIAGVLGASWRSPLVAVALAGSVLLYDVVLKSTPLAPLGMGLCRFLNVALGMSATTGEIASWHGLVAAGVGVYIVGVTLFSRGEAEQSARGRLALAMLIMAAGLALLAFFPRTVEADAATWVFPGYFNLGTKWYLLWLLLAASILYRGALAVVEPSPQRVQYAVKHAILSLIMIDAAAVLAVRDVTYAASIVALLIPSVWLGKWIYST